MYVFTKVHSSMKHSIDILSNIEKVEAPPYLLTRIHQRIANERQSYLSTNWVLGFGFSMIMIFIINFVAITHYIPQTDEVTSIVDGMNLLPSHDIYSVHK
jgi:hypothetical protein